MNTRIVNLAKELASRGIEVTYTSYNILNAKEELGDINNNVSTLISKLVYSNIKAIKEFAIPNIKKISDEILAEVNNLNNKPPLANYSIIQVSIPDVVINMIEKGMVKKETRAPISLGTIALNLNRPDKIRNIIKTDNVEINAGIAKIVSSYTDDELYTLWDKYMVNINSSNPNITNLIYNRVINIKDLVIIYGMISGMINNYPGIPNIDEAKYKEHMNKYLNEVANVIAHSVKQYEAHVAINKLIISVVPNEYKVYVVDVVYDKAIKEGVTPEAILGILIGNKWMDKKLQLLPDIIVNKDILAKITLDYVKMVNLNNINNIKVALHNIVYNKCIDWYKNAIKDDSINKYIDKNVSIKNIETNAIVYTNIENDESMNMEEIVYKIVKRFICSITNIANIKEYLNNMEIFLTNNDITPNQAALYATIDYVVNYLLYEIYLKKVYSYDY